MSYYRLVVAVPDDAIDAFEALLDNTVTGETTAAEFDQRLTDKADELTGWQSAMEYPVVDLATVNATTLTIHLYNHNQGATP